MDWLSRAGRTVGEVLSNTGGDEVVFRFFERVDRGIEQADRAIQRWLEAAERLAPSLGTAGRPSEKPRAVPDDGREEALTVASVAGPTSHDISESELRPVMAWLEAEATALDLTDFWSRIDDEMVRRFMAQGLSNRDILRQFWDIPEPEVVDDRRLTILAVYVGDREDRGTKLRVLESLETVMSASADDMLAVQRLTGGTFSCGYVAKRDLMAFEFQIPRGGSLN